MAIDNQHVIDAYLAGHTLREIGSWYGVTKTVITRILKNNGIDRRGKSEAGRKYSCDHSFFDSIDTEEKAYWLGFIAADGYINGDSKIAIHLQLEDGDHLYKFAEALQSNHPVKTYNYPYQSLTKIVVTSPRLVNALSRYGVIQAKSTTVPWVDLADDILQAHFVRGYFDGDGGFLVAKSKQLKNPRISANITSSKPMLLGMEKFLSRMCDLPQKAITPAYRTAYVLRYSHREEVYRIATLLYEHATVFMGRKYDRVWEYFISYPPTNYPLGTRK